MHHITGITHNLKTCAYDPIWKQFDSPMYATNRSPCSAI